MLERVCEALDAYLALGNQCAETPDASFVTCPEAPRIYDANYVCEVRATTPARIAAVLAETERRLAGVSHRSFRCDPRTPAAFEAHLALARFRCEAELELLLEGELAARPPPADIRAARSDADWDSVEALTRLDHTEEAGREIRGNYDAGVTQQRVGRRRARAPEVVTWLLRADGRDCAFLSSWPGSGPGQVGKLEELLTHADFRRRGFATALLVHGVADSRRRGAGAIVIGARPADTPRQLYASLGFRPLCLTRSSLK